MTVIHVNDLVNRGWFLNDLITIRNIDDCEILVMINHEENKYELLG